MKEKWSIWTPVHIHKSQYELISLQQDWNGVKIIFDDEKIQIEVTYGEELLAFRSCDEGDRWKTIDNVLYENGKNFFRGQLFFKVENSEFKNWYMQENFDIIKEMEFEHHVFITANNIIDVLSLKEPKIKVLNIDNHK